jgi:integrase/recombinase XerD
MSDPTLLGPWVRRFLLEHLVGERNLAANTQKSYRDMLVLFLPYAARILKKSIDQLRVDDISPKLVKMFLAHMEQIRSCCCRTRNQRLACLHAFARFVGERSPEHIEWCSQIRLIPFKRTTHACITYLEKTEMDALLAAPDRQTLQGCRDYALLLFLYNSGARASEAANLEIGSINIDAKYAKIIGKGNKQRNCPLWPATMEQLRSLIAERDSNEHVFLNRCGQPITRFGIYAVVKRYAKKAGTEALALKEKHVSPHVVRHSTATHLLLAGVDINTIRGWLGHVSIDTTNIYAEINMETKAKALATCAPINANAARKHWRDQPKLMEFLKSL